ncbi:DapH/DapD/GlmU-related protein [Paenarthrobacter ilicis]|uniref:Colanic acid biosynthesis acetyltransferase WcaF n=1 Tax=Paenarthrobacter ilicis TaxID=43665 RepID=A0ABX0TN41_9MICC|nr:DapH/DapD/GlmU-related protein [Paenarthrobacter ilicis]MBM7794974.1 putative colanic acid biosynthesis acetyltransferase WcaF [Paenarthrobacter ilicis]NIJ02605.1 putative colanic acid biosynthesis acetyltransferase WcaF [Paenarthrobacter ilicis]
MDRMKLGGFTGAGYDKGRGLLWQAAWFAVQNLVFRAWWCPSSLRVRILRAFGASVGHGVKIRHGVTVHWPWKLSVGNNVWIGVDAWILNLEPVDIGSDCCISQGAFLCTGSHSFTSPTFEFDNAPIAIGNGTWVGARATVLRGVTIGEACLVGASVLVVKDVPSGTRVLSPAGASLPMPSLHRTGGVH